MNNLRKIGLSALAGSLATFSVNAADLSVSGSAAVTFSDANREFGSNGNGFTMGDSLNFSASGELDNGMSITLAHEIDGGVLDDYSITLSGDFGTLAFDGHGASSALGAVDDITPNAYEEAWDVVDTNGATTGGTPTVINGSGADNAFIYTSPNYGGAVIKAYYVNHVSDAAESYMDFAIDIQPEAVEGLRLGFASADHTVATASNREQEETTMYATYAMGGFTVGVQASDLDDTTANSDQESIAYGVTYAVNDDLTVGYNYHEVEFESGASLTDQESSAIGASFTSGSMTIGGSMNTADNMAGAVATDREGYEFSVTFAF
ncbi:porin [Candidatus Pelagibacter sp.]|uniref:porin n=1 Tax=Candidatus Pelagibacter sp. TaxID=2024849 RepID=UPI003F87EB36